MPSFRFPPAALAALLFFGGTGSSKALQLGETEAQILARHGSPSVANHRQNVAMYSWPGWSVRLEFHEGKVAKLTYNKTDDFGFDDFGSLLQANGGLAHWRETSQGGAKIRQWTRDDGATATFDALLATSMTIQNSDPATVVLQTEGSAGSRPAPTPPVPAKPAIATEFFPDPQAVMAKSDSKLSEISVPSGPDAQELRTVKVAASQSAPLGERSADSAAGDDFARASKPLPAGAESQAGIAPPLAQKDEGETAAPQAVASDSSRVSRLLALGCIIFGVSGASLLLYKSLPPRSAPDAPPRRYSRPPLRRARSREICADEFELIASDGPLNGKRCSVK